VQNKIFKKHLGSRKFWNSLSDSVASAESVNSFKSRLDKFWSVNEFLWLQSRPIHMLQGVPCCRKLNVPVIFYYNVFKIYFWKL